MRSLVLIAAALGVAGCDMDPRPPSYLDDLRVLALSADPLEVGPAERVTLEPTVYSPEDDPLAELSWSYCPIALGSLSAYECAIAECEVPLPADDAGVVVASPLELALACPGVGFGLPETFESVFRLRVRSEGGQAREAVLRVPVWTTGPPPSRNRLPGVDRVEVDGRAVSPGEVLEPVGDEDELALRVVLDPESLDGYVDNAGRQRLEEPMISFFSTAGRFERDRDIGNDVTITWSAVLLEEDQDRADLYVVVRDLRGGQVVWGQVTVPIAM